jgi:predicted metalloprotease
MAHRPPASVRRRVIVGALAVAALLATACSPDTDVFTISASPNATEPGATTDQPAPDASVEPAPTDESTPPTDTEATDPDATRPGSEPDASEPGGTEPVGDDTVSTVSETVLLTDISIDEVVDVGAAKPARSHDDFAAAALADIQRWWTEQFPAVYGAEFEPLAGGIYAGYPGRRSVIPGCGAPRTTVDDLQLYVAFYCQFGDFMAYDDSADGLLTTLTNEFGPAVMGVVLAHEYGHTIQERIGALDRSLATIRTEQQADCFAGAWTGQAYRGESPFLQLSDADVRTGLIAMLSVRDPVGLDQFEEGGHGSAFDRVGAFQEGFLLGPARCAELLDAPLELMPNQFQTNADFVRGGNAPYQDATAFLAEDLNDFWATTLGDRFPELTVVPATDLNGIECGDVVVLAEEIVLCPDEATAVYDEPAVLELYREFGDFTLGYFYGIAWAEQAQRVIGTPLAGEQRALLNDCFTGAWVRDITPDELGLPTRDTTSVTSSPGDLDEAIRMAIIEGDETSTTDVVGSPFEKIESFRAGVLGGLDACPLG